ncbi:MAG: hypothetical protein AB1894_03795 [Chloroflexota bacterium]
MKPFHLALLLAILLAACALPARQTPLQTASSPPPAHTPLPTAPQALPAPTQAPSPTPPPPTPISAPTEAPTALPTFTPTAAHSELRLAHLPGLGLYYNPLAWQESVDDIGRMGLQSVAVPGCKLREQGPTEAPAITASMDIGQVHYDLAEFEAQGVHYTWYLARAGFKNPISYTIPVIVLEAPIENASACAGAAQPVLATLHPVEN